MANSFYIECYVTYKDGLKTGLTLKRCTLEWHNQIKKMTPQMTHWGKIHKDSHMNQLSDPAYQFKSSTEEPMAATYRKCNFLHGLSDRKTGNNIVSTFKLNI